MTTRRGSGIGQRGVREDRRDGDAWREREDSEGMWEVSMGGVEEDPGGVSGFEWEWGL